MLENTKNNAKFAAVVANNHYTGFGPATFFERSKGLKEANGKK